MANLFKGRLSFLKGEQSRFVSECQNALGINDQNLAESLKISKRTLTNWKKERYNRSEKTR